MTIFYLDPENGLDANNGLSFANRKKTLTAITAAELVPGDEIRCIASIPPYSIGVSRFRPSEITAKGWVEVPSGVFQLIDHVINEAAWVVSTNVTRGTGTALALNDNTSITSANFNIATAFTTGKIAYKAFGSTQNLSNFSAISFLIGTNAVLPANTLRVSLCSDALGNTPLASLTLTNATVSGITTFEPVLLTNAGPLPDGVNSIALYADLDPPAISSFRIFNIIACHARGNPLHISHECLIGATNSGPFHAISSFSGNTFVRTSDKSSTVPVTTPFNGITDNTNTTAFVVDPLRPRLATTQCVLQEGGVDPNKITISGGWDRTNMSTQTGDTFWSGWAKQGSMIDLSSRGAVSIENFSPCRFATSAIAMGTITASTSRSVDIQLNNVIDCAVLSGANPIGTTNIDVGYHGSTSDSAIPSTTLSFSSDTFNLNFGRVEHGISTTIFLAFGQFSPHVYRHRIEVDEYWMDRTFLSGTANTKINVNRIGIVKGASVNDWRPGSILQGEIVFENISFESLFNYPFQTLPSGTNQCTAKYCNLNGDPTRNLVQLGTNTRFYRDSLNGYPNGTTPCWSYVNLSGTSTPSINTPIKSPLGKFFCKANQATTISCRVQRTSTDCGGGIYIYEPGAGVQYQEAIITASSNTWQDLSLTFTPTIDVVIELWSSFWNSTGIVKYLRFDDLRQV